MLPGADAAIVDPSKVRDYLLSPTHPVGRHKAKFFSALGFQQGDCVRLRDALLALAKTGEAREGRGNVHGRKYEVRGILEGPDGSAPIVAVWILLHTDTEETARFVTAYPVG